MSEGPNSCHPPVVKNHLRSQVLLAATILECHELDNVPRCTPSIFIHEPLESIGGGDEGEVVERESIIRDSEGRETGGKVNRIRG